MSPPRGARPGPSENGQNGSQRSERYRRLHEPRYSQSLERGLAILGCFTPERPVLGIAEIADELGISRSTTHRYVITLFALGYLEQDASRRYRLGLGVTDLGMSVLNATGLREHAHPHLDELRRETSYTVGIAVLNRAEIVYVDRAPSFRPEQDEIDLGLDTGSRLPAYCTAMGKVLLANLPEREQSELLASMKLTQRGPNTITSKNALRVELEQIREEGFAVNDQELAEGLHAIAVPVRTVSGKVAAALGLSAHTSAISLEELVDALGPHLVSTADRISARLGYRRANELTRSR
ncbi:MAG: IclR family transcriptional regulator [Solirubrobacteraceae bacterium]